MHPFVKCNKLLVQSLGMPNDHVTKNLVKKLRLRKLNEVEQTSHPEKPQYTQVKVAEFILRVVLKSDGFQD